MKRWKGRRRGMRRRDWKREDDKPKVAEETEWEAGDNRGKLKRN